jgi:elongation factor P--beta-lysine ligase
MMEWYRGNSGYEAIMDDCERMIKFVVQGMMADPSLFPFRPIRRGGEESLFPNSPQDPFAPYRTPDPLSGEALPASEKTLVEMINGNWERLTIREAFQRYADLNLDELRDEESLRTAVQKKGYEMSTKYTWDDLFFLILLNEIEPHLGKEKPQFLIDYPASQAALARKKTDDPFYAERFELYINGLELCNAFGELVDPVEQRKRLEEEQEQRKEMGKEAYPIDEMFIEALKTMPPSGGNALGIDRLVMVLLGKKSIEEVLLFPWGDVS